MTDDDGWQVEFATAARRDLRRLDPPVRARVLSAVKGLLADPAEGDIKRLVGVDPAEWRLRVVTGESGSHATTTNDSS